MIRLLIILLFININLLMRAQQLSETIAFATDKLNYSYNDSIYVSGILISPDAMQPSTLSNYCILELINDNGRVVVRQKIRCSNATFHARIPLNELSPSTYFMVRAYTQFMRNFEDTFWPLAAIGIDNPSKFPTIETEPEERQESLQLAYIKKHIIYRYISEKEMDINPILSIYSGGENIGSIELSEKTKSGIIIPDSLKGKTMYGMVTNHHNKIIACRSIPLQNRQHPSFTAQTDSVVKVNEPFYIKINGSNEDLCIIIRLRKEDEIAKHPIQAGINRFTTMNADICQQILTGQFQYIFPPEQVLSISGIVKTEQNNTYKKGGSIIAFNNDTGHTYDGNITEDGKFIIGIDDFKDGNSFFIQARNKKGKSYNYQINIPNIEYPGIHFPPVTWKQKEQQSTSYVTTKLDTNRMQWIPEVTIKAHVYKEAPSSKQFYKTNYVDREEIINKGLVSMEAILRKMSGIIVKTDSAGQLYAVPTRGSGILASNKTNAIGFYIDGSWAEGVNGPADARYIIDPADIATIEYIPAIAALQYGVKAFNGVIVITTRSGKDKEIITPQGIHYQPMGLSDNRPFKADVPLTSLFLPANQSTKFQWKAPTYAGNYQIEIEAISNQHAVVYKKYSLKVKM